MEVCFPELHIVRTFKCKTCKCRCHKQHSTSCSFHHDFAHVLMCLSRMSVPTYSGGAITPCFCKCLNLLVAHVSTNLPYLCLEHSSSPKKDGCVMTHMPSVQRGPKLLASEHECAMTHAIRRRNPTRPPWHMLWLLLVIEHNGTTNADF